MAQDRPRFGFRCCKCRKKHQIWSWVSTTLKFRIRGTDKNHSSALLADVTKVFEINLTPTSNNPNHVTVILPKPVTRDVAGKFNVLFKPN